MRKIFFVTVFLLLQIYLFAAARFWVGGGSSANWNATSPTNWSATSGGSNNATVPGSSDDVTFDGVGTNGNTNSTVSSVFTILSLTFTTGYTATVTINNNQSITIAGNFTDQTQHSWSIATPTQNNLGISAASTITSNGKTYPGSVNLTGSSTKTLSGNWTIGGSLTAGGQVPVLNSGTLTCVGLTMTVGLSGTTTINLTGGTWSGAGVLQNSLTLSGNVTVSGTVFDNGGTLTYSSGTITTTSSILTIGASITLNTGGVTWNNVTINAGTITNNSALSTGTLIISGSATFAGTSGWTTAAALFNATSGATITLKNGLTYTITASLNAFTSRTGSILLITSDSGTLTAALTLQAGATNSTLADFTRIDASGGRTINTFHGTLTSTTNIFSYTDYGGGVSASLLFVQ